jgi:hypothetical protein
MTILIQMLFCPRMKWSMPAPAGVLSFENWTEDIIVAMVGAAEQLSPNRPIELTHEIHKVDYRLGIMVRATYDKYRKEMRLGAKVWRVDYIGRGTPYLPHFNPFNHPSYMYN